MEVFKIKRIYMRFPKGRKKALTLSYDDAVIQDKKMMKILDESGLKCTFNINTGCFSAEGSKESRRMTMSDTLKTFGNSKHEIAIHSRNHLYLDKIPNEWAANEIIEDRIAAEQMFGRIIKGFAYPFEKPAERIKNVLRTAGIAYARTTCCTGRFDIPEDWLEWNPTCWHSHGKLMELTEKFLKDTALPIMDIPKLMMVGGHSYEFDLDDNWNLLDEFISRVSQRDDVWYATNMEIYNYIKAYESLQYDYRCTMCYNSSSVNVFLDVDGITYVAKPSETIVF